MKKKYWIRLVIMGLLLCAIYCSSCTSKFNPDSPPWNTCFESEGEHPCDFTLLDQNGNQARLYDYHGKIIILDFSTMWCGPCQMAARTVDDTIEKFGEDEVAYITILIEDPTGNTPDLRDLEDWTRINGIELGPVLGGSRDFLDEGGWDLTGWPTFYFIDKDMVLRAVVRGYSSVVVDNTIEELLRENKKGSAK